MSKKRPKQRTDAERRARQVERLSRLLRVLRCILGSGRWDAESLARELEVSPRTIHRIMQTLSMAGVPWFYSKENECYRVQPGFRFPALDPTQNNLARFELVNPQVVLTAARTVVDEGEHFLASIRHFCDLLASESKAKSTNA